MGSRRKPILDVDVETPGSRLVLYHYHNNGVLHGWDLDRVYRLCRMLRITEWELGRLCALFEAPQVGRLIPNHTTMKRFLLNGHFPPYAALRFTELEAWIVDRTTKRKPTDPPPKPSFTLPTHLLMSNT